MPHDLNEIDRKIATALLESKAVNFEAIGKTIAAVGPSSVFLDDGWERWCGSTFRIFRWRTGDLHQFGALREIAEELRR